MHKRLGKLLPIGEVFQSTTKKISKNEMWLRNRNFPTYVHQRQIFRSGEKGFFTKGKRRYFCEVMGISGTATGLYQWTNMGKPGSTPDPRWFQFTYVLKIIEN